MAQPLKTEQEEFQSKSGQGAQESHADPGPWHQPVLNMVIITFSSLLPGFFFAFINSGGTAFSLNGFHINLIIPLLSTTLYPFLLNHDARMNTGRISPHVTSPLTPEFLLSSSAASRARSPSRRRTGR